MAESIQILFNTTQATRQSPTILLEPHHEQNVQLPKNTDGLFELSINDLPSYHSISQLVSAQDSFTVWKLAIEYYNHNRWQDFDDLCETLKNQYPVLGLAQCTTNLTKLLSSEQSQTNCKLFFEINARTKEAFNHFAQTAQIEAATRKEITALTRENIAHNNKTLFIPDQATGTKAVEPVKPNWTHDKEQRLQYLQNRLLDNQCQRGSDDILTNSKQRGSQRDYNPSSGAQQHYHHAMTKASPKQALPLANIVFAILQFVRVAQSSTLEVTDTTKLKDRLPPFFSQQAPLSLQQVSLQIEGSHMFPMVPIPSTRQAILSTVKATILNIAAQYGEFIPLCYLLLGTIAMYESHFSSAIRYFCLALSKNPLLPPTVRLSIGYCYYYQQRFEDAKIAFSRALNMSIQTQNAFSTVTVEDSASQYSLIKQLISENDLNQCMVDSIIAITMTELAILQTEIKTANDLIDTYATKQSSSTPDQVEEYICLQVQQNDVINAHAKRIFSILNNLTAFHTTQAQHPVLTLYVVQLELARRLFESQHLRDDNNGNAASLSSYLKFFQWDPNGSYLHEQLALSMRSRDLTSANPDSSIIKPQCNVDNLIAILQTVTRHNLPQNTPHAHGAPQDSNLIPASESTLYPTSLSPQVLTQALFLLAHCYFISHRFDLAEECYSLVLHKLSAAVTISPNATAVSHQAGVAVVEQNPIHLESVNRLRTICLLQIAKCLFLCEKITHACTAINRAFSSLPSSFTTFQNNETMYINLEQYLFQQYHSTSGKLYGLGQNLDGISPADHNLIKFSGSGGPDGKVIKPYTDLEVSVNLTYVQIMSSFYSQRKKLYTTTVAAKYSQDENAVSLQKAGSKGKKEKIFTTVTPVQQSMPLLSILTASCLYHFEENNKESRLFGPDGNFIGYDTQPLTDQFNYILLLSINAVVTDLASIQDSNVILFGLFAIFRLLDVDINSIYQMFYPASSSSSESIYTTTRRLSSDIESNLQAMQLTIFKIIFATQGQSQTLPTPIAPRDQLLFHSISRLSQTHKLCSVATWSNAATLCSILSLHYQQFNTRMTILQQAQLTQYLTTHKQQIAELEYRNSTTESPTMADDTTTTLTTIYPTPNQTDKINNPFISLLLPHFPSSLHHILQGSPVSLLPTLLNTQDNQSATGIKSSLNAASAQAMSIYSQSSLLSSSALVATIPLPTNNKDKFPFMQHPTYYGLITSTQFYQQQIQSKAPYDWADISLPTALLCKDNIFSILMTLTSTIAVAMSMLESGLQFTPLIDAILAAPTHTSGIVAQYSSTSQDSIQQLIVKHQMVDGDNCIVPAADISNTLLYNVYGLLLPLPLPVHSVSVLQSLTLSMRTFFTSYPFDKYAPNALTPQPDHFNIFTYSLQSIRQRDFMKLMPSSSPSPPSSSISSYMQGGDVNSAQPLIKDQTPQQYHFNTYIQHIANSSSLALTITGLILSSHGASLQTRLSRVEFFLNLHDLFVNIESIRQKIHYTRTITDRSITSYNTHVSKSTNGNLDLLDSILSPHAYCTSSRQLSQYQSQPQSSISTDPTSLFKYIDPTTDYMGLAVYFGHYSVAIIKLLQDSIPDRPIMVPLPSLPATYYDDILTAAAHSNITSLRSRTQDHYLVKNNLSFSVLPGIYAQLDRSGFDDLATILTTHAVSSYLELVSTNTFTPATQFTRTAGTNQLVVNADKSNATVSVYSGHVHPFYQKRFQKQRQLHQNNIIYNSDCILIGRNVGSQIDGLIQQTTTNVPRSLPNAAGVSKDVKIFLSKAFFGSHAQRLYPKCLYLQLHFTHPHLICSDGSLYSTVTPQLYSEVSNSQLAFISTSWNWHGNQNGLCQEPPLPEDTSPQNPQQSSPAHVPKDGKRGEHIIPRDLFPYMYTNLYIHHPTVHQSANSRTDSVVKQIITQFGQQLSVTHTSHNIASLREYVYSAHIILKFKRAEKERIKAQRLRETISYKESSLQQLKQQMAILDTQRQSNPDLARKYDQFRNTISQQEKRMRDLKPDIQKAIGEFKSISFEILSTCNMLILGSQQDALDFISASLGVSKDDKDKTLQQTTGSASSSNNNNAMGASASKRDATWEDLNHSSILLLVLSSITSINLLREHHQSTPVKDQDQYRLKLSGVQYNLRQIKALLIKACMSSTSTYQFITATTMYHNTAPLSLIFTPPHLYTPLTANLTGNNPPNPYSSHSNTGIVNQFAPLSVSISITIFQTLATINEQLNNADDAIYYAFITAALAGLHKTLSTAQHPLWFLGNVSQIYNNDHRPAEVMNNIHNNFRIGEETGIHNGIEKAIQMTNGLISSYPTRTYLQSTNDSTYSYFILPSILDCDVVYVHQLAKAMTKSNIYPISLLSQLRHSIILQLISQHHLSSFIDFSRTSKFTVSLPHNPTESASFVASLLPYGKFDSYCFSAHVQPNKNPSLSHGLLSFALQPLVQCCVDYSSVTLNLALSMYRIALQCYRFYSFVTGLTAASDQIKFNPHSMLFNLRSLLTLQQPEYHAAGSMKARLTDTIISELLVTTAPFNQIPLRHFNNTPLHSAARHAQDLRDPSKQIGGAKNFLRGTINLSPFDAALTCWVANFSASALYFHLREVLSALLPNPQPSDTVHVAPPQSLQLPPLYLGYATAQTNPGMSGHRTITYMSRAETGNITADKMTNSIHAFIQRETERTDQEIAHRKTMNDSLLDRQAVLEQQRLINEADQVRASALQLRAKQSHAEAMQLVASRQEYNFNVAQPHAVRDLDQLPTKEKKSRKSSSSTSERNDKKDKKSKKSKKEKRKSRRSSRRDGDQDNEGGDYENMPMHFGSDEDDEHANGSDRENNKNGDSADDNDDNGDDDDDDDFISHIQNNNLGDEFYEAQSIVVQKSSEPRSKTRFDGDDSDDESKTVKKHKKPRNVQQTASTDQIEVSIGVPAPALQPSVTNDESTITSPTISTNITKRRLIIDSDDE